MKNVYRIIISVVLIISGMAGYLVTLHAGIIANGIDGWKTLEELEEWFVRFDAMFWIGLILLVACAILNRLEERGKTESVKKGLHKSNKD